ITRASKSHRFVRIAFHSKRSTEMRSSKFRPGYHRAGASIISILLICLLGLSLHTGVLAQRSSNNTVVVRAVSGSKGVLLEWRNGDVNNVGFNIYRIQRGQRTLINGQIIAGGIFHGVRHVSPDFEQSYSWFDKAGTADSTYEIESIDLFGAQRTVAAVAPIRNESIVKSIADAMPQEASGAQSPPSAEQSFPGTTQINTPTGPVEDQWVIASKFGLKIHIKSDGWYRVTQQQMAAAGFNPTVDIRNLSLYGDGKEVAIRTNKDVGQLVSGDFIEFYGRGIDIPTADTRIYYLIAETSPGKRVTGDIKADVVGDDSPTSGGSPVSSALPQPQRQFAWLLDFYTGDNGSVSNSRDEATKPIVSQPADKWVPAPLENGLAKTVESTATAQPLDKSVDKPVEISEVKTENPIVVAKPEPVVSQRPAPPAAPAKVSKKRARSKKKAKRRARHHWNHADADAAAAGPSFDTTVLIKERYDVPQVFHPLYYVSLLNGDKENYFGRVLGASATYTINANPELTADGPAKLEIALQGILNVIGSNHSVNVEFNGMLVGSFTFGPLDNLVRKINIPTSSLLNGANTLKITKTSTGEACLVDYVQLTYPHAYKADNNSLRMSLRPALTAKIDGFSAANLRLIDYTDPFAVKLTRPKTETTALGYAITIPNTNASIKGKRLLYATLDTQFNQPAALSLN